MQYTEAEIKQVVDDEVQRSKGKIIEDYKAKQINKRFTPGYCPEDKPKTGGKFFVNANAEYSSTIKFLRDVRAAGTPGGIESDELRSYVKATQKDMSEGDLSSGGYAVPTQAASQILERALERSIVRPRATVLPMSSNKLELPSDVDENHATNYFGGITIYRPGEAGQKTASNPTLSKICLQLHKLTGLVHVSDELLDDAPALEAWLIRKFSQTIAFVEDYDFLNGSGVNQALGVLNSGNPALITVPAVGGQGASTIIAENIIAMWARLWPDGQNSAIWVANIDTFPQLASMAIAVGAGGVPVWLPANQIAGKPYRELMGCPLILTEKVPTLGTAGDIALIDFSQYLVGEKGGLQVASSIHFRFDYDQQSFRFVLRYDGQPSWTSALTPRVGAATLSPYVVLSSTRT